MTNKKVSSVFNLGEISQDKECKESFQVEEWGLPAPNWSFWKEKQFIRPWQAIFLSLNIEPTKGLSKKIKEKSMDEKSDAFGQIYLEYKKRKSILRSQIGQKLEYAENHISSGEDYSRKYIDVLKFIRFAEEQKWHNSSMMRDKLGSKYLTNENSLNAKQEKNILLFLDQIIRIAIESDGESKYERKLSDIKNWFKKHNEEINLSDNTIRNWLKKIEEFNDFK